MCTNLYVVHVNFKFIKWIFFYRKMFIKRINIWKSNLLFQNKAIWYCWLIYCILSVSFTYQNDSTSYHPCRVGIWSAVVFLYRLTNQLSGCSVMHMHSIFYDLLLQRKSGEIKIILKYEFMVSLYNYFLNVFRLPSLISQLFWEII